MNRQVNPDHCYEVEGVMYMIVPTTEPNSPEWNVTKDGRVHRIFTSLAAAKGWLEHVLEHPASDRRVIVAGAGSADFKAKLSAALNASVQVKAGIEIAGGPFVVEFDYRVTSRAMRATP